MGLWTTESKAREVAATWFTARPFPKTRIIKLGKRERVIITKNFHTQGNDEAECMTYAAAERLRMLDYLAGAEMGSNPNSISANRSSSARATVSDLIASMPKVPKTDE